MSALSEFYEREHDELRRIAHGDLDLAAQRARVAAAEAARKADAERVAALLNARPAWQQQAGVVDVAALRAQERQTSAQQTQRQRAATRRKRWRTYIGEHPTAVDRWGEARNHDPESPPEWFV